MQWGCGTGTNRERFFRLNKEMFLLIINTTNNKALDIYVLSKALFFIVFT